jgi:hypothetical protein
MERASEGNSGRVRKLTRRHRVTRVMSGEIGNFMVKVDVKENVGEELMMTNTKLLEAWVNSGKEKFGLR